MKNFLFIFLFFILFSELKFSSAQIYHPFPDTLASWSEVGVSCPFWEPGDLCSTYDWLFSLGHDTIIDGKDYILVGYNLTAYSTWILGGQAVSAVNYSFQLPGEIFGAIREDSDKKVWYRKLKEITQPVFSAAYIGSQDSDILLYDFGVSVGDSLLWTFWYAVVDSIDSVELLNGEWHKRINLHNSDYGDNYWIEGMGSNLGFFGAYQSPIFEGGDELSCFEQNDLLLFSPFIWDSTFECNQIYTGLLKPNLVDLISVFPNPTSDFLIFYLGNFTASQCEISIYNSTGQLLRHFSSFYSNQRQIPVDEIGSDGMYFYTVKLADKKIFAGKFLIQR